jgi:hypothetical protein
VHGVSSEEPDSVRRARGARLAARLTPLQVRHRRLEQLLLQYNPRLRVLVIVLALRVERHRGLQTALERLEFQRPALFGDFVRPFWLA